MGLLFSLLIADRYVRDAERPGRDVLSSVVCVGEIGPRFAFENQIDCKNE